MYNYESSYFRKDIESYQEVLLAVLYELRFAFSQREAGNSSSACRVLPTSSCRGSWTHPRPSCQASTRCDCSWSWLSHPPAITSLPCDTPTETCMEAARCDTGLGRSIHTCRVKEKNSVWSPVTATRPSLFPSRVATAQPGVE